MKESVLILRLEECDKIDLAKTAKDHGMSISDFCRMLLKLGSARFFELDRASKIERKAKALLEIK